MEQVADNVFRLGTHGHSFYLLCEGDEATVVDAGCSREWGKLVTALSAAGLSIEAVRGMVITHSHADHFGLAKRARDHHIPVMVHEAEQSRADGTYTGRFAVSATDLPMYRPVVLRNFLPMILSGVMSLDHIEDAVTFEDREQLDLPGQPVPVHTPGHTEGHVMVHLPDRGILFTGDGLVTMPLLGGAGGPQMLEDRFHNDPAAARMSLDAISDLDADLLLPGHGLPWKGSPARAVELARSA